MFYASVRFKISLRKSVHVASSHDIYIFLILVTLFIYLFIYLNYQQNKLSWVDEIYKIFTFLNKQYFYKTKYN